MGRSGSKPSSREAELEVREAAVAAREAAVAEKEWDMLMLNAGVLKAPSEASNKASAVIIGSGAAGIATAVALRSIGWTVTIYDRAVELGKGYGWLLMPNGVDALEKLGVQQAVLGSAMELQTAELHEPGCEPNTISMDKVYCATRQALCGGLASALPAETIVLGAKCSLQLCAEHGRQGHVDSMTVEFTDGSTRTLHARSVHYPGGFDLVVSADGVHSELAHALNPSLDRKSVGRVHTIVTGTREPRLASRLEGRFVKTYLIGEEQRCAFGLLGTGQGYIVGFMQFDTQVHGPAPRDGATLAAFLQETTRIRPGEGQEQPENLQLIRRFLGAVNFDVDGFHNWRPVPPGMATQVCCMNGVIIGDAAHPMSDFSSQGVSSAMEDAIALAEVLQKHAEHHSADPLRALCGGAQASLGDDVNGAEDGLAAEAHPEVHLARAGKQRKASVASTHIEREPFAKHIDDALHEFDLLRRPVVATYVASGEAIRDNFLAMSATGAAGEGCKTTHAVKPYTRGGRYTTIHRDENELEEEVDVDVKDEATPADDATTTSDDATPTSSASARQEPAPTPAISRWAKGLQGVASSAGMVMPERMLGDDGTLPHQHVNLPVLHHRAHNYRWASLPRGVLPLTAASSDFPVAPCIVQAMQQHIRSGYFCYGPNEGLDEYRATVASYFSDRLQAGTAQCAADEGAAAGATAVSAGCVMACNAAAAGVYAAVAAIVGEGDEALVMSPVDFLLDQSVRAVGATVVRYAIAAPASDPTARPTFDLSELARLVTPRTRLLSVCNPHNPLGVAWTLDELRALATFAEEHDLTILSDEVWGDLVHAPRVHVPTMSSCPAAANRTFTVLGFSKSHGLEGLRIGAVIAPTEASLAHCLAASGTATTANGASVLAQVAAIAAMREAGSIGGGWLLQWKMHLQASVRYAAERLNAMPGVTCRPPEACFILWADVTELMYAPEEMVDEEVPLSGFLEQVTSRLSLGALSTRALATPAVPSRLVVSAAAAAKEPEMALMTWLIETHKVAIIPGLDRFFGPGSTGHIRVAVATSHVILSEALDRLQAGLAEWPSVRETVLKESLAKEDQAGNDSRASRASRTSRACRGSRTSGAGGADVLESRSSSIEAVLLDEVTQGTTQHAHDLQA